MATHDYVLENASGAAFRTDLNNALAAIVSNNSNSSSPATTYAYQWWADTSAGTLKIRNSANNAWIELLQLDGTITLEDGSATAPALAFRDDLNTGIFSSAGDTFNIATAGAERLGLHANGTVFNQDGVDCDFRIESDTNTHAFFLQASNSKIGINNSSPNDELSVAGSIEISSGSSALRISSSNPNVRFTDTDASSGFGMIGVNNTSGSLVMRSDDGDALSGSHMGFEVDSGEKMRITSDGDLCINTTSSGSNKVKIQLPNDNTSAFLVKGGGSQGRTNINLDAGNTDSNSSTSYRLRDSSGNTVASLFFMNNADDLIIGASKQGGEIRFHTSTASNSLGSIYRAKFDQNGNFHLGGSSDSYNAKIRGFSNDNGTPPLACVNFSTSATDRQVDFFHGTSTSRVGSIQTNASATAFNTSSDYRLKENAVAISDGITRLKTLKPYRFNFKVDANTTLDGFFAHEVTPAVPEAISGEKDALDSNGNIEPQSIDQSKLVPLLVAAVQELITKVETLEAA